MRKSPSVKWFFSLLFVALTCFGQSSDKGISPWELKTPLYPTFEQYKAAVAYWAEKYPKIYSCEQAGKSLEGQPIYLIKITDPQTPEDEKQTVLITGLHSGLERSGTTTILHTIEWLLSDDPLAVETRKKQTVLFMPIVNPYAYCLKDPAEHVGNSLRADPYACRAAGEGWKGWEFLWDINTLTLKYPDKTPELVAVKRVFDRYKPEVHFDVHGISLKYPSQIMFEEVGMAYSNISQRFWDWRITEAMIREGNAAGFGYDRAEASAQRLFNGPNFEPVTDFMWSGTSMFFTAHYAYIKYHTMLGCQEVTWDESGLARIKGLLKIGNTLDKAVPTSGYKVDVIKSVCWYNVVAWGTTAEQKRDSRVDLWKKQQGITLGMLYPETDTRVVVVCGTSKKAADALKSGSKESLLAAIENRKRFNAANIKEFLSAGPERAFAMENATAKDFISPRCGLAVRLRIPYVDIKSLEVRLNGNIVQQGKDFGYQQWIDEGLTCIQVNIPPDKAAEEDLFVVTCKYIPEKLHKAGWQPSKEIQEYMKKAK